MSKTVLFQTIQFCIRTQLKCKYSSIVKNISISSYSVIQTVLILTIQYFRCYHSNSSNSNNSVFQVLPFRARVEQWQWRGAPHSPKLQHYWNLTIRLFSVISGLSLVGGFLPLCRGAVSVFYSPSQLGKKVMLIVKSCQRVEKEIEGKQRKNQDHTGDSIFKIS